MILTAARRRALRLGARAIAGVWLAGAWLAGAAPAAAEDAVPVAIAEFDNVDTAGESGDLAAAHAGRVDAFDGLLADSLSARGGFAPRPLACAAPPCSAGNMAADDLLAAARRSGARLLIYGGIHKMSTLVQMGKVQVIDLEADRLLLDRAFSFRGDSDEAFARAAAFLARDVGATAAPP